MNESRKRLGSLSRLILILYGCVVIYFVLFSDRLGRVDGYSTYRYNLVPFVEIRRFWVYRDQLGMFAVFTNIFGNVIGFIPYGFILPVITHRCRNGFFIILSGFALSLTVETIQLVTRSGCFDVDDLILNTLGAAMGYLIFAVCDHLRRKHYGKKI